MFSFKIKILIAIILIYTIVISVLLIIANKSDLLSNNDREESAAKTQAEIKNK